MNIKEFINDVYPIKDKVQNIRQNPIKQILENDDLPCDAVKVCDGELQKVVYVSDGYYVPVMELLSYEKEEVKEMKDVDFKNVYFAYMENVEVEDVTLDSIMSSSREYRKKKQLQEEMLKKCTQ